MHVLALAESLDQVGVTAEVSHDAQFYLGIVRRDYDSVRTARNKGLADLFSPFSADRDVLKVWLG